MECMICGKRFEDNARIRFCPRCGAELIDTRFEHELREQLAGARDDTERDRVREQLAACDAERGRVKQRWVRKRLDASGEMYRQNRLRAAVEEIRPALKADPANPELHVMMSRILFACEEYEEALRAARLARRLAPGDERIEELFRGINRARMGNRRAGATPVAGAAPPPPPAPRARAPRTPRPPRRRPEFGAWLQRLVEKGLLRWWYVVGTFILMAGVIGLVTWQWNRVGSYFVFTTVLAVTAGLYTLGHYLSKRIRLGSSIVLAIASGLVPIAIWLFSRYEIAGTTFDTDLLGIAGAIIAATVYAVNFWRTRDRALFAFLAATPIALLFFILRGSGLSVHYWGLWFVGLAALYFAAGYLMRRAEVTTCSKVLFAIGNATVALGLLTTIGDMSYFLGSGLRTSGVLLVSSAAALLIGSYAYDDRILAYVSSLMILASSFFLTRVSGTDWYLAAPALGTAAGVLLLLGFIDSRLFREHEGKPFIYTGVIAVLAILAAVAGKDLVFNIPRAWSASGSLELRSSLITAAIASGLLWAAALLERKKYIGYLASSAMVYASLVGMGYWRGSLPMWFLIEATVVAGSMLVIGAVLDRFVDGEWGLTAYIPGFAVAGASTLAAAVFYLPAVSGRIIPELRLHEHAYLGAAGTALAMTLYLVAATARTVKAGPLYGACLTATMAEIVQAHALSHAGWVRTLSGGGVNYGMLLLPLAVLLAASGHILSRLGREDLAIPPLAGFAAVASFCLVSQFFYLPSGASAAIAVTFGAMAVIAGAEAALWKRGEFIYPGAVAALMMVRELVALCLRGTGAEMNYLLYMSVVAVPLAVAGSVLAGRRRSETYSIPMLVCGSAFSVAGFAYQVAYMARGMTYSVPVYMGAWALVSAACALSLREPGSSGSWREIAREVALSSAIAHAAVGAGWLAWTLSHRYMAVALVVAGLGSAMTAARMSLSGRIPGWVERQLRFGSIAVGIAGVICSFSVTPWQQYYVNVICVAAVTLSALLTGFADRSRNWLYSAIGGYSVATLVSFLNFVGREAGAVTRASVLWQCGSLAAIAAAFIAASEVMDDLAAYCAAHLLACMSFIGLGWCLDLYPAFTGYWLAGAAVLAACGALAQYTRRMDDFSLAGLIAAAGLFAAAIVHPMATGWTTEAIVTLGLAIGVSVCTILVTGRERFFYLPLALSAVETIYILATRRGTGPESLAGLVLMGPALLYLGVGRLLKNSRSALSDIFLQFAAGFTVLGTLAEIVVLVRAGGASPDGGILMVAAFFTAASVYAAIGVIKGYGFMGHVSFAHFLLGYVLVLIDGHVSMPHLYCLPAGIYLIALGYWAERVGRSRRTVQLLHLVGFITLAFSSLIPSFSIRGGWNPAILLTESLAAIAVAFWQRRKVFLGAGLTFIVVDGMVQVWKPVISLHWSIYAVSVGALVLVGGILFETRRELLLEKGIQFRDSLRAWK